MKFILPEDILKQHLCVLGKTGSGKSSALRYIVEHLLDNGKRVCIIDPKGDWAGLKVGGDGKSPGYPVIGFGDFKEPKGQDVPINDRSGKDIAELIASGNRPCIIGFRGWTHGAMIRFWIDFAQTLFNANSGELYLVGDEFHNLAAKGKIIDIEAGKCLHWSNRLMSEGRGYGLVCLIASQRPQKVHNDTLTCCETLVAMRVIHKADRDAVQDWIDGCGDSEKGKEVLNALAGMERGEAYVWSPEINFGPKRLIFPMFKTFDSFAPPQLQKAVSQSGWSTVDLSAVKEKLSAVIQEHKDNDPRELKNEIVRLNRELTNLKRLAEDRQQAPVKEVPCLTDGDKNAIRTLSDGIEHFIAQVTDIVGNLRVALDDVHVKVGQTAVKPKPALTGFTGANTPQFGRATKVKIITKECNNNGNLGKCERAILTCLAQYPEGRSTTQIAVITSYSVTSGGFNNSLGCLRSQEMITRGPNPAITPKGQTAIGEFEPLPTGPALIRYWIDKVGKCEGAILSVLAEYYPGSLNKTDLATQTGYSETSGGFNNALGRLRTLELIDRGNPIKASDHLFQ